MSDQSTIDNRQSTIQSSPCLQGERVSFTGTLASMTHQQAQELAEQHGGTATTHVSKQTTMLVVGEEGWPLEPDGRPSQKLQQVTEWQQEGLPIRVLNESEWLHLLGLEQQRREVHRLYTPAMLSQLLDVPVGQIRSWERVGLIHPVRKVYRLPYFEFQEVSSARRLVELLASGVSRRELEASLKSLSTTMGGVERPLAQLNVLARDAHVLYRDEAGLVEPRSGQRVFDFGEVESRESRVESQEQGSDGGQTAHHTSIPFTPSPPRPVTPSSCHPLTLSPPHSSTLHPPPSTPTDWFHEGCRLASEDEPTAAIEAFRMCLMDRPGDPEVNLHLAESLLRAGQPRAALERYHAAVEADHDYIEAWTQLGCVHAELGELDAAAEALRIALDRHPDYPDAHWHLADVLCRLGHDDDAVAHWQAYLVHDSRGPWAATARQRLESRESRVQSPEHVVDGVNG